MENRDRFTLRVGDQHGGHRLARWVWPIWVLVQRQRQWCKVHMSWKDKYGEEAYVKGGVLWFYISRPNGER